MSATASVSTCQVLSPVILGGLGSLMGRMDTSSPLPRSSRSARRRTDLLFSPGRMRTLAVAEAWSGSTFTALEPANAVKAQVVRSRAFISPPRMAAHRLMKGRSGDRLAYTSRQGSRAWRPASSINWRTGGV